MKFRRSYFVVASFIFFMVALGSWGARSFGWYNDYWYTDIILHLISGIALGFLWVSFAASRNASLLTILSVISFATFGSFLWELWEFAGWRITPSHTQFYIPELGDTLFDMVCGAVGGLIAGVFSGAAIKVGRLQKSAD